MTRTTMRWMVFAALMAALLLVGCSKEIRRPAPPEMPDWCKMSSGVVDSPERGRLVVGVGRVEGIRSVEMARANADGQARQQMARLFGQWTELLIADYRDYLKEKGLALDEGEIQRAAKIFAQLDGRAAPIEDRYKDNANNAWYAKAVVEYQRFVDLVVKHPEIPEGIKTFVSEHAEELFRKMERHAV